jgi:hypothetical protein
MTNSRRRLLVIVLIASVLFLTISIGFYGLSYHQTHRATIETFSEFGSAELDLYKVSFSRSHILWFLWRIKFEKQHKFMPGDLVYWRLRPFGEVEFTK